MKKSLVSVFTTCLLISGCAINAPTESVYEDNLVREGNSTEIPEETTANNEASGVTAVSANENTDGSYIFSVTIASDETGCDRYANWWEVITEDGTLLYRRILAHSHVDEQPFTRSGGPVEIDADEVVILRSHMHPTGYHTQVMQGSFTEGFESISLPADFATELAEVEPLPSGCTF